MKKDLPNDYANPLNKTMKNVQEIYYGSGASTDRTVSVDSVLTKINRIFNSNHHVYKSRVRITTSEGDREEEIVGRTNGSLLTLSGERIKIIDILDIERI